MMQTWDYSTRARAARPWPTWVAVSALWFVVLADVTWVYALFFLAWGLYDLVTGKSSFVQHITRRENPITYWLVVATWIVLSVLWITNPR